MAVDRLLPTVEGAELVGLVREIATQELQPKAAAAEAAAEFPREMFRLLGDAGMLALPYPEEYGGVGPAVRGLPAGVGGDRRGLDDGRGRCLGSRHGRYPLATYGTPRAAGEFLPEMLGGDSSARTRCPRLRRARTSPAMTARAEARRRRLALSGAKAWITHGRTRRLLLDIRAQRDRRRGISCFHVPGHAPGLTFGAPERKMGLTAFADRRAVLRRRPPRRRPADRRRGRGPPDRSVGAGLRATRHRRLRHRAGPGCAGPGRRLRPASGSSSGGRSRSSRGSSSCWPRWRRRSTRHGPAT